MVIVWMLMLGYCSSIVSLIRLLVLRLVLMMMG